MPGVSAILRIDGSDDGLGRVHVDVVKVLAVLPSSVHDFGSNSVAGFNLVVKMVLVF